LKPQTTVQILRCLALGGYTATVEVGELRIQGARPLAGPLPASIKANRDEIVAFLAYRCGGVWPPARDSEFYEMKEGRGVSTAEGRTGTPTWRPSEAIAGPAGTRPCGFAGVRREVNISQQGRPPGAAPTRALRGIHHGAEHPPARPVSAPKSEQNGEPKTGEHPFLMARKTRVVSLPAIPPSVKTIFTKSGRPGLI